MGARRTSPTSRRGVRVLPENLACAQSTRAVAESDSPHPDKACCTEKGRRMRPFLFGGPEAESRARIKKAAFGTECRLGVVANDSVVQDVVAIAAAALNAAIIGLARFLLAHRITAIAVMPVGV